VSASWIVLIVWSFWRSTSWDFVANATSNYRKLTTKKIRTLLFEFAARLPKIKKEELYDTYPPVSQSFFDTMNIQKELRSY
jgi:hypothetical protein